MVKHEKAVSKRGRTIAVMNAKGGVGKSTVTLLLAEFLSVVHSKRVLLIDADPQSSLSLMVMTPDRWQASVSDNNTIAGVFASWSHQGLRVNFPQYIHNKVSNIETEDRLALIAGSVELSYLERQMASRASIYVDSIAKDLMAFAKDHYDLILIDCQPSVTLLTELWLRFTDYHLLPCRCDFPSFNGLAILDKVFNGLLTDENAGTDFSDRLGVILNMRSRRDGGKGTRYEATWEAKIREVSGADCFEAVIPADAGIGALNNLPDEEYDEYGQPRKPRPKSFAGKYEADVRREIELVVSEFLSALQRKEDMTTELRRQARWLPPKRVRDG